MCIEPGIETTWHDPPVIHFTPPPYSNSFVFHCLALLQYPERLQRGAISSVWREALHTFPPELEHIMDAVISLLSPGQDLNPLGISFLLTILIYIFFLNVMGSKPSHGVLF